MANSCRQCKLTNQKKGCGEGGVADAIGNWGYSNEVASPGHELSRMQCLLKRMEALREPPKYCPETPRTIKKCRPQPCCLSSSKRKRKNCGSKKYPLIIYSSIHERIPTSDAHLARKDAQYPVLGRTYVVQREDKMYKLGPMCCPQPCCPAPCCPQPTEILYCQSGCCTI